MKVLRFAQEIDHSAQRFYEEMAWRSNNPGVGRIFQMLAEDEGLLLTATKPSPSAVIHSLPKPSTEE